MTVQITPSIDTETGKTTELVELPAIMVGNTITIADYSLRMLDGHTLKEVAKMMSGQVVWVWRRIEYKELEVPLCAYKGCDRPALGNTAPFCDDHPNGETPKAQGVMGAQC